MGDRSAIEWTDATWNPIRARDAVDGKIGWHCEKVSPGCTNCYAERLNKRLGTSRAYSHRGGGMPFLDEKILITPLRWRRPRRIFVCSMSDLFGEWVPEEWIDRVFAVMALAPQHTFQVLTKRALRMRSYVTSALLVSRLLRTIDSIPTPKGAFLGWQGWPIPNIWLGVSAEDQQRLDERVPELLKTPAAVRWISAEPLLGPLDFRWGGMSIPDYAPHRPLPPTDWVVVGGESGPGARPMHPSWARSIRDQCQAAAVPYFFKQWGEWALPYHRTGAYAIVDPQVGIVGGPRKERPRSFDLFGSALMRRVGKKSAGRELDGRTWDEFPEEHP